MRRTQFLKHFLKFGNTLLVCILLIDTIPTLETKERIVGGVETTIDQMPYLVYLRQNGRFICGGSLITKNCVLTAAHCVQGVVPSSLTINAGVSRLSEVATTRQVQKYFVSPFYSPATLDMDVAIIKMNSALSGHNIGTIRTCNRQPGVGQTVRISGWGITNEYESQPPDQLRTANIKVVPKMDCVKAYADKVSVTSSMFCATEAGERDSCSGDSGGPVVYNGQVCGIVSWGIGCARSQYPGVYTNVASARINAFLKQTMRYNC